MGECPGGGREFFFFFGCTHGTSVSEVPLAALGPLLRWEVFASLAPPLAGHLTEMRSDTFFLFLKKENLKKIWKKKIYFEETIILLHVVVTNE